MTLLPHTSLGTEIPVLLGNDFFDQSHESYFPSPLSGMRRNRDSVSSAESGGHLTAYHLHRSDSNTFSTIAQSSTLTPYPPVSLSASISGNVADDVSTKVQRPSSATEQEPTQLFACPYTKFDPHKYSASNLQELKYRSCGSCYLTDISRLKQHLYRVHERPQHYCPVCYMDFKDQDKRDRHIKARTCRKQPCPFEEKMTPDQLMVIKKKNRGMNPTDSWYDIYQTLFKGAVLPASPYASFSNTASPASLDQFMQYVQEKAPPLFRQQLGHNVSLNENLHHQILTSMETLLSSILQNLKRDYEHSTQSDGPMPSSRGSPGQILEDEDQIQQRMSRKRKATDSSLQVPSGAQYTMDAQSLGSYGDVSAPGSYRSTSAVADDEAEYYGRQPMASPAKRFATSHSDHRDVMQDLHDHLIPVTSGGPQWAQTLQIPGETNPYYQHETRQRHEQSHPQQQQQTSSSPSVVFPDPTTWHTDMMTAVGMTSGVSQPGYPANAPAEWMDRSGNQIW